MRASSASSWTRVRRPSGKATRPEPTVTLGGSSNVGYDLLEQLPHLTGDLTELRIVDRAHRRHRIDGGNLHRSSVALLHDHVAGQHGPDLVLVREGLVGELRVACSQNEIRPEIDTDLLVQGILHIDLGEDPKAVLLQGVGCGRNRSIK